MNTTNLATTLLLIAALCLLPSWLVGCAALGGALGLLIAGRTKRSKPKAFPDNVVSISGVHRRFDRF